MIGSSIFAPLEGFEVEPRTRDDEAARKSSMMKDFSTGGSWPAADIGFFHPDMPFTWGGGEIIEKDDKTFYRSAVAFANRLRVAEMSRSVTKISQNLDTCFRGEALRWWNAEIDNVTRRGLIRTFEASDIDPGRVMAEKSLRGIYI
jgi:hypothetical protein